MKPSKKEELNSTDFLKSENISEQNKISSNDSDNKLNEIISDYLTLRNKFNELWNKIS